MTEITAFVALAFDLVDGGLVPGEAVDCASPGLAIQTALGQWKLFGHAGAIYLTTMGGDVVRIGTSTAPNAGDESANGEPTGGASGRFGMLGWRQVY